MHKMQQNGLSMMSQANFFKGYSRFDGALERYETWEESVARVMQMHREKYASVMTPELSAMIDKAEQAYRDKLILGAQRALQFGGEQIHKHNARLYNCSFSYADRPVFFQHAMYLLLAGCGVGFSVQKHHVAKLPAITRPGRDAKVFSVPDSIEGWADAFGVLLSSYFVDGAPFPEYQGVTVHFDLSEIRPAGAYISGGFKAPGPEGLRLSLERCRGLLERQLKSEDPTFLSPINVYDFVMHMADAVLSGGIRRAATLCLFSKDDPEMMNAKTGDWFVTNPQRARSNNSVLLVRSELTHSEFLGFVDTAKQFGEPGFVLADSTECGFNPCVEIGMWAKTLAGVSGFQFCNLTETNGGACVDLETLLRASEASAILGTLQAGYTHFPYLDQATKEITEREALLGCSITGWMSNPQVLFNEDHMRLAAQMVVRTNEMVAKMIGINPAARTTTVKPSGNASVLLGCASGIHGEHAPRYFRNIQMHEQEEIAQLFMKTNPAMVARSVWSASGKDVVISFPIEAPSHALFKSELMGVKQLAYVRKAQQAYIASGKVEDRCVQPFLSHNVSNTISVDDWDMVGNYIYEHREDFAGVSLMAKGGDRAYAQAPFTEVFTAEQITAMYGDAAIFASGLIVDGLHAFNNNLWRACDTLFGFGEDLSGTSTEHLLMRDWVRRGHKFAKTYFGGDLDKMCNALKDVSNLHKWSAIQRQFTPIDFINELHAKKFTDVNTMGAQACAGGVCELVV